MRQTKLKAPFSWIGGKSKLAKNIIELMPNHNKYVEVFGGALSVFYQKETSKIEIVNDINSDLINLHRTIRTSPQTLNMYINELLSSRELFYDIKFGRLKPRNNIERAAFYFYELSLSFGGKGTHFAMPKKQKLKNIYRDFSLYSRRLRGAVIENMDYEKLIKTYDETDALFYLDPPYVGTQSYYKTPRGFNMQDHENLAGILKDISGKFILSYNDCEVIRDLYKGFNIKELNIKYTLGGVHKSKDGSEILIMNY